MSVKIREKCRKRSLYVVAVVIVVAGCASPRPRPEPAALEALAELPPHVIEVAEGLFSCERGYLIRQGRCISFADIPPGPAMEVSSLPSAGDGAPETCPSGGCGSWYSSTPSYSFVYSGVSSYDYWPSGFYYGGLGGVLCPPRARRFQGGEFALGGRFGAFVQERRFVSSGGFFGRAPLRAQSSAVRRSQAGGRFGGNRTGRWR
jgi:hypothetical protein